MMKCNRRVVKSDLSEWINNANTKSKIFSCFIEYDYYYYVQVCRGMHNYCVFIIGSLSFCLVLQGPLLLLPVLWWKPQQNGIFSVKSWYPQNKNYIGMLACTSVREPVAEMVVSIVVMLGFSSNLVILFPFHRQVLNSCHILLIIIITGSLKWKTIAWLAFKNNNVDDDGMSNKKLCCLYVSMYKSIQFIWYHILFIIFQVCADFSLEKRFLQYNSSAL